MIQFKAKLLASLCHGGGVDGSNVSLFRRETILGPDGPVKIPIVTGNALRGVLRRQGAWLLAETLDLNNKLGVKAVRILSSGGALVQEKQLTIEESRALRNVPHLGLWGWSGCGAIHDGAINVQKLVPVCAETVPVTGVDSDLKSGRLMDLEQYTRHDSSYLNPKEDEEIEKVDTNQMIYQVETMACGAELVGGFRFKPHATQNQIDWFHACLRNWRDSGAHIGGRSATGHGRLEIEESLINSQAADRAVNWLKDNRDDVTTCLGWLK